MRHVAVLLIAVGVSTPLAAQGNLSTQGYGFPQGQLMSRALSMGGSIGEIDPSSALNPASLGRLTNRTVLFQIEPEYRTNSLGATTDRTTTARYPLVSIGVPFGPRWVIGVSASTLLDRTWATTSTRSETVSGVPLELTANEASEGAINDLRLATAWTNHDWLYVGLGFSGVTGRNVVSTLELFSDTSFAPLSTTRVLAYSGSALSAGIQLNSRRMQTVFGLSYRMGNSLTVESNDSTIGRGNVPDRFGASVAFTGIQGTVLAARAAYDGWSSMSPMLTGGKAHDSWELGGGAEVSGPRLIGQTFLLRTGFRARQLPFEAGGRTVNEKAVSFGTGANFGGGRMSTDVTLLRQWRNADLPSVKERAWTLSLSLTARP